MAQEEVQNIFEHTDTAQHETIVADVAAHAGPMATEQPFHANSTPVEIGRYFGRGVAILAAGVLAIGGGKAESAAAQAGTARLDGTNVFKLAFDARDSLVARVEASQADPDPRKQLEYMPLGPDGGYRQIADAVKEAADGAQPDRPSKVTVTPARNRHSVKVKFQIPDENKMIGVGAYHPKSDIQGDYMTDAGILVDTEAFEDTVYTASIRQVGKTGKLGKVLGKPVVLTGVNDVTGDQDVAVDLDQRPAKATIHSVSATIKLPKALPKNAKVAIDYVAKQTPRVPATASVVAPQGVDPATISGYGVKPDISGRAWTVTMGKKTVISSPDSVGKSHN